MELQHGHHKGDKLYSFKGTLGQLSTSNELKCDQSYSYGSRLVGPVPHIGRLKAANPGQLWMAKLKWIVKRERVEQRDKRRSVKYNHHHSSRSAWSVKQLVAVEEPDHPDRRVNLADPVQAARPTHGLPPLLAPWHCPRQVQQWAGSKEGNLLFVHFISDFHFLSHRHRML